MGSGPNVSLCEGVGDDDHDEDEDEEDEEEEEGTSVYPLQLATIGVEGNDGHMPMVCVSVRR